MPDSRPIADAVSVVAASVIALIWIGVTAHLYQERAKDRAHAIERTAMLARRVEDNVARTVESVDRTLLTIRALIRRDAGFSLQAWARETGALNEPSLQLAVADRSGVIVDSTLPLQPGAPNIAERPHVREQARPGEDALSISEPLVGRTSNRRAVQFSRRLAAPEGGFGGVVVASLDPDRLARLPGVLDPAGGLTGGTIAIIGADGTVRAATPDPTRALGTRVEDASPVLRQPEGSAGLAGPLDGIQRIVSWRQVHGFPLIVVVGIDTGVVFASWRRDRLQYGGAGLVLSASVAGTGWLLARQRRRLLRSRFELGAALARLEVASAELARRGDELAGAHRLARLGTWSWHAATGVTVLSPELAEMLGFGEDRLELDGHQALAMVHPEDRETLAAIFVMGRPPRAAFDFEVRFRLPDGGLRHCRAEARIRPGPTVIVDGICQDISDLKQAQAAALRAEKLQVAGQLTGGVAHDFNNLLTVVMLTMEDALSQVDQSPMPDGLRPLLARAHDAALRGGELTHALLAYAGRQKLRPERLEAGAFLARLIPLLGRALGQRHVLRLRAAVRPAWFWADVAQLEHAVLNLTLNARDASPHGGTITLMAGSLVVEAAGDGVGPGRYVAIEVGDDGVGIAPELLDRVFEPFFTTKDVGQGSGLGLSMAHGFARQSGGRVRIDSRLGEGTTVQLLLPAAPPGNAAGSTPDPRPAWGSAAPGSRRALVVEDQAEILEVVRRILEQMGFTVDVAVDGPQAAAQLDGPEPYQLLFTDVVLPGRLDGVALGEAAVAADPDIRVVLTSGYKSRPADNPPSAAWTAAEQAGRTAFLAKPYRRADLRRLIETMFGAAPSL